MSNDTTAQAYTQNLPALVEVQHTIGLLYLAFLGRPADVVGLEFWTSQITSGASNLKTLASFLASSAESANLFAGQSNECKRCSDLTYKS